MIKSREIVKRVTQMVVRKMVTPTSAAELLETSVRTIFNYSRKYTRAGAAGLVDRRHGHYRKITPDIERQIVEMRRLKAARSARWIRNRLRLDVSVETVRRVLKKHKLNGHSCASRNLPSA